MKQDSLLFSAKQLYAAIERTQRGWDLKVGSLPADERREYVFNNRHIASALLFGNDYPIINPYNGPVDFEVIGFNQRNKSQGQGQAVHFFLNDWVFRRAMWERLEKSVHELSKFDAVFAPDFSLWTDLPDFYNKESLFKNRLCTAYMQSCGFNVIPVASFGNVDSLSYCLCGLPQNSVIAISGVGHLRRKADDVLWHYALREIDRQLNPTLILIYGPVVPITGVTAPVRFIKDYITKKFRKYGEK